MVKKIISLCAVIAIIAVGYYQKGTFLALIHEGGILAIFISMLLVAICVFFPIVPFPILAGTIGALFGVGNGVLISLTGAMAGTMVFFFLCRYGFRDFAQSKLLKYSKAQQFDQFLMRNSFIAVLTGRLIPVIPAIIFNTICSLSKVKWFPFFIASSIGKLPNILILSYAGSLFSNNKLYAVGLYGLYLLLVVIINYIIISRRMSQS